MFHDACARSRDVAQLLPRASLGLSEARAAAAAKCSVTATVSRWAGRFRQHFEIIKSRDCTTFGREKYADFLTFFNNFRENCPPRPTTI